MQAASVAVLKIGLGLESSLKTAFEGLGLASDSTTYLLGLVSVSDQDDLGFYFKNGRDHNCLLIILSRHFS